MIFMFNQVSQIIKLLSRRKPLTILLCIEGLKYLAKYNNIQKKKNIFINQPEKHSRCLHNYLVKLQFHRLLRLI